jgi:hypothetical protein
LGLGSGLAIRPMVRVRVGVGVVRVRTSQHALPLACTHAATYLLPIST